MKIQDNFSDTHLLFSAPVNFTICDDENAIILAKFKLKLPTVADLYFNECIGACLSLLRLTPAELSEHFKVGQKFTSHLDFLYQLLVLSMHSSTLAIAWSRLFDGIKELCPDLHISENILYIQGAELTDELLERLRTIWLIAAGNKTYSNAYQYMSPEQRAYEEKIQAIKNKGKSRNESLNFEKIYMILTYEFGYSREEILKMTMYAVNVIIKYTSKSINYKLTLAAKAYGNTKKLKFITDQGD